MKIKISPRRPTRNKIGKRWNEDFVTEVARKLLCKPLLYVTGDSEDTREKVWDRQSPLQREAN